MICSSSNNMGHSGLSTTRNVLVNLMTESQAQGIVAKAQGDGVVVDEALVSQSLLHKRDRNENNCPLVEQQPNKSRRLTPDQVANWFSNGRPRDYNERMYKNYCEIKTRIDALSKKNDKLKNQAASAAVPQQPKTGVDQLKELAKSNGVPPVGIDHQGWRLDTGASVYGNINRPEFRTYKKLAAAQNLEYAKMLELLAKESHLQPSQVANWLQYRGLHNTKQLQKDSGSVISSHDKLTSALNRLRNQAASGGVPQQPKTSDNQQKEVLPKTNGVQPVGIDHTVHGSNNQPGFRTYMECTAARNLEYVRKLQLQAKDTGLPLSQVANWSQNQLALYNNQLNHGANQAQNLQALYNNNQLHKYYGSVKSSHDKLLSASNRLRNQQQVCPKSNGVRPVGIDYEGWWLDTGASVHGSNNRSEFKTYKECTDGRTVWSANGTQSKVVGIGDVELKFTSGKTVTLTGVHYVPELRKKLISGDSLNKEGFKMVYESNILILTKNNVFFGNGYSCNRLIKMNLIKNN